jgi:hypothetical protein
MKFKIKIEKEVEASVIQVHAKVSDRGAYTLQDENGNEIAMDDGYVPGFFPYGGGDYLVLDIELKTGLIKNWTPPRADQLEDWVKDVSGEDN